MKWIYAFLRLLFLPAFLLPVSCGDPSVSYCEKVAEINAEYSAQADKLVEELLKLKKMPTLPALEEKSRNAAEIVFGRDRELADLDTEDVDQELVAYVNEERKLLATGGELAEEFQRYFEKCLKGGAGFSPSVSKAESRIGRARFEVRKIIKSAKSLEEKAKILQHRKSARLGQELPPLYFRLPEMKQLLSVRHG